nr:hypothetical protein [Acidobacteriota bacterium]
RLKTESVTEGMTRILESPEANRMFGQEFYEQHGQLAQPTNPLPAKGNGAVRSLSKEGGNQNRLLLSTIMVASLAVIAIVLFFAFRSPSAPTPPSTVVIKQGGPTIQPPVPPIPPVQQPPAIVEGGDISNEFPVYPDANITMQTSDSKRGKALQLITSDPVDKVADWYMEKMKPAKVVRPDSETAILQSDQMSAFINAQGSQTIILLRQGKNR